MKNTDYRLLNESANKKWEKERWGTGDGGWEKFSLLKNLLLLREREEEREREIPKTSRGAAGVTVSRLMMISSSLLRFSRKEDMRRWRDAGADPLFLIFYSPHLSQSSPHPLVVYPPPQNISNTHPTKKRTKRFDERMTGQTFRWSLMLLHKLLGWADREMGKRNGCYAERRVKQSDREMFRQSVQRIFLKNELLLFLSYRFSPEKKRGDDENSSWLLSPLFMWYK